MWNERSSLPNTLLNFFFFLIFGPRKSVFRKWCHGLENPNSLLSISSFFFNCFNRDTTFPRWWRSERGTQFFCFLVTLGILPCLSCIWRDANRVEKLWLEELLNKIEKCMCILIRKQRNMHRVNVAIRISLFQRWKCNDCMILTFMQR